MQKNDIAIGACLLAIGLVLLTVNSSKPDSLGIQISIAFTVLFAGIYFLVHGIMVNHLSQEI